MILRKHSFLLLLAMAVLWSACKKKDDDAAVPSGPSDLTSPVITLVGEGIVLLPRNTGFQDPGAKASDDVDGDISDRIRVSNNVDSSKLGIYNIVYTVEDRAGNDAVPVVRNVEVVFGRDDYLGAYSVEMDPNCPSELALNSPQQLTAGSSATLIIFNGFFPVIGGEVPAEVNGTKVTIIPTTIQGFLNVTGNGEMDETGKVLIMDLTIENTLPFIGGIENCQATYTRL